MRGVENRRGGVVLGVAVYGVEKWDKGRVIGVDGGYDGKVVLELVEMVGFSGRHGDGVVERIGKRGIVRAKGHFANDVGEVECCEQSLAHAALCTVVAL